MFQTELWPLFWRKCWWIAYGRQSRGFDSYSGIFFYYFCLEYFENLFQELLKIDFEARKRPVINSQYVKSFDMKILFCVQMKFCLNWSNLIVIRNYISRHDSNLIFPGQTSLWHHGIGHYRKALIRYIIEKTRFNCKRSRQL